MSSETPALAQAIKKLATRQDLTAKETEAAFGEIMEGVATDVQKAALLIGLRAKGETAAEVAGGVRALQKAMVAVVAPDRDSAIDTCGTGGGAVTTFNISTGAAFVVAGGGVPVAKHGNRSFSSRCGSADVLEALGVNIAITADQMGDVLSDVGISFLFAPSLHPAMRHVGPVRRELAVPTIMNLLGPLTNPARVRRQVVGVADRNLLPLVAGAFAELGHLRSLVVHGEPGMDELSPLGRTEAILVEEGEAQTLNFDPADELGWTDLKVAELGGAEPGYNARVIEEILGGRGPRAARAAVALNAAAGFYVAGEAETLKAGVEKAEAVLDEGKGMEVLDRLRAATRALR